MAEGEQTSERPAVNASTHTKKKRFSLYLYGAKSQIN